MRIFSERPQLTSWAISLALLFALVTSPVASQTATNTTTPEEPEPTTRPDGSLGATFNPDVALVLAKYVGFTFAGIYGLIFLILFSSMVRFRIKVWPEIDAMVDVDKQQVSEILSFWAVFKRQCEIHPILVSCNILLALVDMIGLSLLSPDSTAGTYIVFVCTSFSICALFLMFLPNHELIDWPLPMKLAQKFQHLNPPVQKDRYYHVSDETLDAWFNRPETWSFDFDPWGAKVLLIERAEAVPPFEMPDVGLPKPVQVDKDEERERELNARAAGRIQAVIDRKAEELRLRAERREALKSALEARLGKDKSKGKKKKGPDDGADGDDMGKTGGQDQEEDSDSEHDDEQAMRDLDEEEEEVEEIVGPEIQISDEERLRRLCLAWLVDPRALCHLAIKPTAGVCTVLGDYPLPTWQKVSYFEVYLCDGAPGVQVTIGLCTRPFPQWRVPGWNPLSVGYNSRGYVTVSTCDFEKPYSMPWGAAASPNQTVNETPWQDEVRAAQDAYFRQCKRIYKQMDRDLRDARDACQTWDCVGVMYNRKTGRVRFSLNGRLLKPACHLPGRLFYPAICVDNRAEFRVNFGTQPFHCTDFDYMKHGFGRNLRDPDEIDEDDILAALGDEADAEMNGEESGGKGDASKKND